MKTPEQLIEAREAVKKAFLTAGLSYAQQALLSGLSVALCWVAGVGGVTLQRLIDGEPLEPKGWAE